MGRGKGLEVKLTSKDRQRVEQLLCGGWQAVRTIVRALALLQMDQGQSPPRVAANLRLSAKAVWQIGKRYQQGGIERALFDAARPGKAQALNQQQRQSIIAVVCSAPPQGRARWTVRLLAEEVVKRNLVPHVGRETIRVLLQSHDLKPWREKNVVRGKSGPALHRKDGGGAKNLRETSVGGRTGGVRGRKAGRPA